MSEPLRVALITEGPTDTVIIEAALKAILPRPFVATTLQPEATRPAFGGGWCGVLKWCRDFAGRGARCLEEDPLLSGFDLFVVHVDADVAECSYADGGQAVLNLTKDMASLPCSRACPPAEDSVNELRDRVLAWLGLKQLGPRTILCVPSKSIEAWIVPAVLDPVHRLSVGLECQLSLEAQLASLAIGERIKKGKREYQRRAGAVTAQWASICALCTQAQRFDYEVRSLPACAQSPAPSGAH